MNELTNHLNNVIDIWFSLNKDRITERSIKDLQEVLQMTVRNFYE